MSASSVQPPAMSLGLDRAARPEDAGRGVRPAIVVKPPLLPAYAVETGRLSTPRTEGTPAREADDAALIARASARDAQAFRVLVERHLPSLLGVARRMLRDEAEAEDVAQEALIRLWQQGAALELGAGGARPWLRRVVANLCIDRIRAGRRTDVTDEVPEQEVEPDQLSGLLEGDLAQRVERALQSLPERQRLALTLFHYEGMSQVEVGSILGVSDEAVESLLSRARRALRSLLKDDWKQLLPGSAG